MGIRRSDWIVVGANIGFERCDDEHWEKYDKFSQQDKIGEITYLIDGMSGDYFIVGTVIRADEDGYNGFGIFEMNPEETYETERELARLHIKENFGIDVTPKIIVLTHWT